MTTHNMKRMVTGEYSCSCGRQWDADEGATCPASEPINIGALDPQQRLDVARGQPAPAGAVMTGRLEKVIKFLLGEDEIDGYGFGETPPHHPKFWWRRHLRDEIAGLKVQHLPNKHVQSVPEGWRLVPEQPTDSMVQAVIDSGYYATPATAWPILVEEYKAMLAAAPVPPVQCQTCNDNGRIGGPSFYAPDEGGDACPDCSTPQPPAQVDEREAFAAKMRNRGGLVGWMLGWNGEGYEYPPTQDCWEYFQAGAAWQRTQASPAPSADGGKVESDEVRRLREDAALYREIERAAGSLPEGWIIRLGVELGAGYIELYDPDGCEIEFATDHERLNFTVADALEAALSASAEGK